MEHEGVLLAALQRLEVHRATHVAVAARAAGDRDGAVLRVVEGPLDGDLPAGQERRPVALVRLPRDGADAVAVVGADLRTVLRVEHLVGERQHVTRAVARRTRVGRRVGLRVALALPLAPGPDTERDREGHGAEDRDACETLHGVPASLVRTGTSYPM